MLLVTVIQPPPEIGWMFTVAQLSLLTFTIFCESTPVTNSNKFVLTVKSPQEDFTIIFTL